MQESLTLDDHSAEAWQVFVGRLGYKTNPLSQLYDTSLSNSPKSNVIFFSIVFCPFSSKGAAPQSEINVNPFHYNKLLNCFCTFKLESYGIK